MGFMPFKLGSEIDTTIYGGPYWVRPKGSVGVKLASEIDDNCHVRVDVNDWCVPDPAVMKEGLIRVLTHLLAGNVVYVGCRGGVGRTGLFLASLIRVKSEYQRISKRGGQIDPVLYVRYHYDPRAVETRQQVNFVRTLDVTVIVHWFRATQRLMRLRLAAGTTEKVRFELDGDRPRALATLNPNWFQRSAMRLLGMYWGEAR